MPRLRSSLLAALGLSAAFAPNAQAIVGGTDVPDGKRDYVAYITIDNLFACSGTLVAPTKVVTAGHCSSITGATRANVPIGQPGQAITVTLGSIEAGGDDGETFTIPTTGVKPHPNYSFTNNALSDRETDVSNDVAILTLPKPTGIKPVQIANKDERSLWTPGTVAQIAGFGVDENGDAPDVMQETTLPIVTDKRSGEVYGTKEEGGSFEATTQIGAGLVEGGRDTCQGDSGGPLIVTAADGSLRLVGDTSYGRGCAEPDTPGIYGRVADDTLRPFFEEFAPGSIAGSAAAPSSGGSDSSATPSTGSGSTPQPAPSPTPSGSGSSNGGSGSTSGSGSGSGGGSGGGSTGSGSGSGPVAPAPASGSATARPSLALSAALDRRRLRRALTRGVRLRARVSQRSTVTGVLKLGSRTVARGTLRNLTGRKTFSLRFTRAGRKALKSRKRARLSLTVVATAADGQRRIARKRLTLKR